MRETCEQCTHFEEDGCEDEVFNNPACAAFEMKEEEEG